MRKRWQPGCPCCCSLFYDDYERAPGSDVGDNYTEVAGDWTIQDTSPTTTSLLIQSSSAVLSIDVPHPSGQADGIFGFAFFAFDEADQVRFLLNYVDADNYKFVEVETNRTESGEEVLGAVRMYSRTSGSDTLLAENSSADIPPAVWHVLWVYWGPSCQPTQRITISGSPTGGTFTLSFDGETTAPIAYDAAAADITSALESLANVTAVATTGGPGPDSPWYVEYRDPEHATAPAMTADGSGLSGGTDAAVSVTAAESNASLPYMAAYMPLGTQGLDNAQEVYLCQVGGVSFSEDAKALGTGTITTAVYWDSLTGYIHLSEAHGGCPCFRCCTCQSKDVLLLVDTTGSMGTFIQNLKAIFRAFESEFARETCRWAVAEYKDFEDGSPFNGGWNVVQAFTDDFDLILAAVEGLAATGGGDLPEQNFAALEHAADEWTSTLGGRTDPSIERRIIWGGDAPSWNGGAKGFPYPTRAEVIDALTDEEIEVYALNVAAAGGGIDGGAEADELTGQASEIASETGGLLVNHVRTYADVREAICRALE